MSVTGKITAQGGVTPPQNSGGQGTHNVSHFEKAAHRGPRGHTTQALVDTTPSPPHPRPSPRPRPLRLHSLKTWPHSHHTPPTLRLRRPVECAMFASGKRFLPQCPQAEPWESGAHCVTPRHNSGVPPKKHVPTILFCPPLVSASAPVSGKR